MRRALLLSLLIAFLTGASAAHAATTGDVDVSVEQCGPVNAKGQLGLSVSGQMEGTAGTKAMSIEVALYSRRPGEAFRRALKGRDVISGPAVARYLYGPHTFVAPGIATATDYRARMTFRWTATDGSVATVRRWSSTCRLTPPQPDLTLGDNLVTTATGQPGLQRYTVAVRNDGRADAGAFDVALSIGAETRRPVTVTPLAAGASTSVTFVAPRCSAGDVLRFEADPDNVIAEEDERDNVLTVACPISG